MKLSSIAVSLVLITLAACGKSTVTAPPVDPAIAAAGVYNLYLINGAVPPLLIAISPNKVLLKSGSATLNADHTYLIALNVRVTPGDSTIAPFNATQVEAGTYTMANTGVYFTPANGKATRYTAASTGQGVFRYTGDNLYTAKFISNKY